MPIRLDTLWEHKLTDKIGQLRAALVSLGRNDRGFLVAYSADFDVDPWHEMFYFPTDTLKLALLSISGRVIWQRDLGRGVVPGMWFVPAFPMDMDGDGADEIYFVNNVNEKHPLSLTGQRLERLDVRTGKTTGQWPWLPAGRGQEMAHAYRHFILGGYVRGQPVLVAAHGTYRQMTLRALHPTMETRWEITINDGGARGSHQCPVVDLNHDGVDEILWGERCISLDDGRELFCADRDTYHGHSDIIQPVWNAQTSKWSIYTCRENHPEATPRVVLFDDTGNRIWGDVDRGHMDMGWVARLGPERRHVAMAVRIGAKTCGPDGRHHQEMSEFTWDLWTGQPVKLPMSVYRTVPVDLDGDGYHELVRGAPSGDGLVVDRTGKPLGHIGGSVALASKLIDHPGEQMLSYHADGHVKLWVDREAADSPEAKERYAKPFYRHMQRFGATGSHLGTEAGV